MRFPWSPKKVAVAPTYVGRLQRVPGSGNGLEVKQELWVITNEYGIVVTSWKSLERAVEAIPDGWCIKKITFSDYVLYTGVGKDGCV